VFPPAESGQVIVLFAGAIATLLIVAALAFDVGSILVERRDQQDAADAASLAGARYVLTSPNFNGLCPTSGTTGNVAVDAACQIALQNGFSTAADGTEKVHVYIPALHGRYAGLPHFVEVQIDAVRPSIFAGIVGRGSWPVGSMAVATNGQNLAFPFGMIALNPTACKAIQVSGSGTINSYGSIQANSDGSGCISGGDVSFSRTGGSTINVLATDAYCRTVGTIQDQGSGSMTCTRAPDSFALPDPLRNLPGPPKPALAPPIVPVGNTLAPAAGCPGSASPATEAAPTKCDPGAGTPKSSYNATSWIIYPGLYPGGLAVSNNAKVYLMPGIYWIGGGGVTLGGGGPSDTSAMVSISSAADATSGLSHATWSAGGGGVMIYNSSLPNAAGGPITLNGKAATLWLKPFHADDTIPDSCADLSCYSNIVIFQDRSLTTDVTINGSNSTTEVRGLIYVPGGTVTLNGDAGTVTNVDQIIADQFKITGNGGTLNVDKGTDFEATIVAAGLVD